MKSISEQLAVVEKGKETPQGRGGGGRRDLVYLSRNTGIAAFLWEVFKGQTEQILVLKCGLIYSDY